MKITQADILKALSKVEEPDLKQDLVTLDMIKDIKIEGLKVGFTILLTTPACPLKELLKNSCIDAIKEMVDKKAPLSPPEGGILPPPLPPSKDLDITVNFTSEVTSVRADEGPVLPKVKNIVAVASGKGGVGKSTITANLAVALARSGAKVGLIDADIFGPSIPGMFNVEDKKPGITAVNGKNMITPIEQYGVKLISIGFLAPSDNAVVWRGPMASSALKQFISDSNWGGLDYLFIDLPPGTSDIHLTLVQTVPLTGAIVVTTPQKVALDDAQKAIAMFQMPQINVPVLGIVENMSYFTPPELPGNKYYIFGKDGGKNLAKKNNIPLLGCIPLVQKIRESGDNGHPAILDDKVSSGTFTTLAESVAQQIAIRNAFKENTKIET